MTLIFNFNVKVSIILVPTEKRDFFKFAVDTYDSLNKAYIKNGTWSLERCLSSFKDLLL